MKILTCCQLGGPANCMYELKGDSFEGMGDASRAHVKEMLDAGDEAHLEAVNKMKSATPEDQQEMMERYRRAFEEAPEA